MALDFPANPSEGQTYIAENGVTYTYVCDPVGSTSCGWIANSQAGLDERYVNITGDNMTGDLTLGTDKITLDADDGNINASGRVSCGSTVLANYGLDAKNASTAQGAIFVQNSGTVPAPLLQGFDGGLAKKIEIFNNGSIAAAGSGEFAGNVLVGGALPNAPNITLNADGYATFKQGYFTGGYGVSGGQASLSCTSGSGTIRAFEITNDIGADIVVFRYDGSTWLANGNINFSTSGSATFVGNVVLGTDKITLDSRGLVQVKRGGENIVWAGRDTDQSDKVTSKISANGAATFAGTVTTGDLVDASADWTGGGVTVYDAGVIYAGRATTGTLFVGRQSGNPLSTVKILADGSAEFAGDVISGRKSTSTPYVQIYAQGTIVSRRDNASKDQAVFFGGFTDGSNYQTTSQIFGTGSATFAGTVKTPRIENGNVATTNGVTISETGYITLRNDDASLKPFRIFRAGTNDPNNLQAFIGADGTGWFSGTVTANGNVLTRNVVLNLEADDDTKYTATTDEDGVETRVYNGATLDVKDRLQKTDAALTALKSAAAAAVDFAALKSAIATALADI